MLEQEVQDRANGVVDKLGLGKATDTFMRSRTTDANTMAMGHTVALRLDRPGTGKAYRSRGVMVGS